MDEAVERHVTQYGVTEFVVGHYGRFDAMAAAAVRAVKKRHVGIALILLLPYYPFNGIRELSAEFDSSFYPPGLERVPKRFAIVRANGYMIRHSDFLICYNEGYVGSVRMLMSQAVARERKGQLKIENLAEQKACHIN